MRYIYLGLNWSSLRKTLHLSFVLLFLFSFFIFRPKMNTAKIFKNIFLIEPFRWLLLCSMGLIADMFHAKISFDLMSNKVSWQDMFLIKRRASRSESNIKLPRVTMSKIFVNVKCLRYKLVFFSSVNVFNLKIVLTVDSL